MSFSPSSALARISLPTLAGKLLKDFKFEEAHNISCMGVYTNGVFSVPTEFNDALKANDKMILFGTRNQLRKFSDAI